MKRLLFCLVLLSSSLIRADEAAGWIAKGDAFDAKLKTREALEAYLKAESARPQDPDLLIKIAKQYGESMVDAKDDAGKKALGEKALAYAKRAAEAAPDKCDAHLAVAICYGRLLDLVPARTRVEYSREVKQEAETAVRLDPQSDYAWHMLGRWHQAAADLGGLTKGIVKIVYGGLPDASFTEAEKCFKKAHELKPDRLAHVIELGITQASLGKNPEAKASLEKGLAMPNRERDDPGTKARGRAALAKLPAS